MATVAGLDGVLGYLGIPHPCVTVHLLLTLGMLVLGLGSPEISTLLPIPLYSCWGGLTPKNLYRVCKNVELLPETLIDDNRTILECTYQKWQPFSFPGNVLVGMRVAIVLIAGLCMDIFGRRRSAVAWMGLYFVVSFARAFPPNAESVVFCVTLEGAAAQATSIALLMLATEGSTQTECVRSVCLMLLGHAIGVGAGTPLIRTFIPSDVYSQMARSLPSLAFVIFIIMLPESARWSVCRGRIHEATIILKKSHHMSFDPTMKNKLSALHKEHKQSLAQYNCSGHALRESLQPLVKSGRLFLVFFVFLICGLALGCAASARHLFDPTPYNSFEDRQVAFGAVEFISLLLMGLIVTRLHVKWVLVSLMSILSVALLLTPVLKQASLDTCGGFVFFSCLGHTSVVLASVWMSVGVIRLTPTHSRGLVLGSTFCMATLGHALVHLDLVSIFLSYGLYLDEYAELGIWAIVTFVAGLLALLLPKTPSSLPDTLSHIMLKPVRQEKFENEEEYQNTHL
ncbi:organic cation/carnitine transporter 2 isoform X1 [Procambarus clarkii]|uniref:organic cation/carnitine transporter 2 isoform X1 n=2 Tax=Procambarus clarkii TaxID=6728 RepID=UPI0037428819